MKTNFNIHRFNMETQKPELYMVEACVIAKSELEAQKLFYITVNQKAGIYKNNNISYIAIPGPQPYGIFQKTKKMKKLTK